MYNFLLIIIINLTKTETGFEVILHNHATHALFVHPLRMGQLRVEISRDGTNIKLTPAELERAIGKNGKEAMPWLADSILKDTTIKAHETKRFQWHTKLQKGDRVAIKLGYYIIKPKSAQKLGIADPKLTEFLILITAPINILHL